MSSINLETLLQSLPSREDIARSLPSREDLAGAIGFETRQSSSIDLIPALSLFGTGMLFGAGLALLFAPKTGQDMRTDLSRTMHQYGYGEGEDSRRPGERQMASESGAGSSRQASQQDYPRQMSGQTSAEQSRQSSSQPHTSGQTPQQMAGHQSEQRSESELARTKTRSS